MKLLKGKKIADAVLAKIKADVAREKIQPSLAVVLIGNNKASQIYVALKEKAAKKVGIKFNLIKFSERTVEKKIIQKIKALNSDEAINGIIVQLPLPKKFNTQKIINAIDPRKDVDGFLSKSALAPVFPKAILKLIEASKQKVSGKKAVIVVNSQKFGKTMAVMLRMIKISGKYILASSLQKNIQQIQKADVLISAVGKPSLITGVMLKKGAIVVDGGITKVGKKVVGDVDLESVEKVAAFATPVPGGVGPVTIACLLENVYLAAKKSR